MKRIGLALAALMLAGCGAASDAWFVRDAGADMPVWVRGNLDSGKILVFLHGGPGDNAMANTDKPVFQALEKEMAIAYWEQRGSGASRGAAEPDSLTVEQFTQDLDAVIDALKLRYPGKRVVLMSYSWGGAIGVSYLADAARQAKVAGWIDMDGVYDVPDANRRSREWMLAKLPEMVAAGGSELERWREALAWYQRTPVVDQAAMPTHLGYVGALEHTLAPPKQLTGIGSVGLNFFSPFSRPAALFNNGYVVKSMILDPARPAFMRMRLGAGLAAIQLPTLVLWGRYDCRLPVTIAQTIYDGIGTNADQKTLVVAEHAGHTPYSEDPEAFETAVKAFMATR